MEFDRFGIILLSCILVIVYRSLQGISAMPLEKIVDGDDASIEDFPSMISLRKNNRHFCGGSLISDRHVLTAAHCVVIQDEWSDTYDGIYRPSVLRVHTGTNSSKKNENSHAVSKIYVHELYTGSSNDDFNDDVAIITLKNPIKISESQKPIALPTKNVKPGQMAQIAGWGDTYQDGYTPERLQKAETEIIDSEYCQSLMLDGNILDTQLCTLGPHNISFCDGDSGGPLIVDHKLVGVVSYSYLCGDGLPNVYMKVFDYVDWITRIINDEN